MHPTLVSFSPFSSITIPEIISTCGRRTAASDGGGRLKMGEVKGLMYENFLLNDFTTGVVYYPDEGHTCGMTGRVRSGDGGDGVSRDDGYC